MDPVTIGVVVAALLLKKATEGMADEAGKSAWSGLQKLYQRVHSAFGGTKTEHDLVALEAGDQSMLGPVAGAVAMRVGEDATLRQELADLVMQARQHPSTASVVARAEDNAKQVNIGGDNYGSINL